MGEAGNLPRLIRVILSQNDAWIIGSTATTGEISTDRDIDIFVEFSSWRAVSTIISHSPAVGGVTLNINGGLKFTVDGFVLDIWPDSMSNIFTSGVCKVAWNPIRKMKIVMT